MMAAHNEKPKTSFGALIGIPLLIAYILLCNSYATQYLAEKLGYQYALGRHIWHQFYMPFNWLIWAFKFGNQYQKLFTIVELYLALALIVGFVTYALSMGLNSRKPRQHDGIHGTAHWADEKEVRATGLLNSDGGVYVGGWTDKKGNINYLRHNGPEHVLLLAPTRSGKGVSLIVPTLLSWGESCVVLDSKGELFNMSAGWRAQHANNVVIRFDPASSENGAGYNPLDCIRFETKNEIGDVQNTMNILVDPDGKGLNDHWSKTAHAFLVGVVLHEYYCAKRKGKKVNLADVALALSDPTRSIDEYYSQMLFNQHLIGKGAILPKDPDNKIEMQNWQEYYGKNVHIGVAAAARDMLNRHEEERGSVLSTAMSYLALYRDPLIAANISRSDFQIEDLMDADKPHSLYLVIRQEDKDRLKPLIRMILNQIVRVLLRPELKFQNGKPLAPHKHRLLLMLDEFPSYGRLEVFQESLAFIAGFGIKAYIVCQDMAQLRSRETGYGTDETITANCHVRIAFAPNRLETAEWISGMSGTMTVIKEDFTTSGARFGAVLQNVNRAYHELSRPLLTVDEALRLKAPRKDARDQIVEAGEVLVFVAGHAPIKGTQTLYFQDPTFSRRAKIEPPIAVPRNINSNNSRPDKILDGFKVDFQKGI